MTEYVLLELGESRRQLRDQFLLLGDTLLRLRKSALRFFKLFDEEFRGHSFARFVAVERVSIQTLR